jgi:hypothetical protein
LVTGAWVIRLFASGNEPQPRGQDVVVLPATATVAVWGADDEPTTAGAAIAAAGTAMTARAARIVLRVMWWMYMMSPLSGTLTWTTPVADWFALYPGDFR